MGGSEFCGSFGTRGGREGPSSLGQNVVINTHPTHTHSIHRVAIGTNRRVYDKSKFFFTIFQD